MNETRWQKRALILSFWIFSSWYLYIGGLLTEHLNFLESLLSIFIANFIFVIIFTFYAGTNKGKDILFQETFGSIGAKYFISLLPSLSQIGWYAIVTEIGGTALALALGLKNGDALFYLVILVYGAFTIWVARGGMNMIGKLSLASIPAMVGFAFWGAYAIFHRLGVSGLTDYQPSFAQGHNLGLGIQILIASFISAAVTIPDFLHDLGNRKQIFLASLWGMIPATLLVGGLGAAFAIISKNFNVLATLQLMNGPFFVYAFLSVDNLCGAQAVFPVGTGLASVTASNDPNEFEKRRRLWTLIGGAVGILLAMIGVVGRLELWLNILGMIFAPIIGVVLANQYFIKKNFSERKLYLPALVAWVAGSMASTVPIGIPILNGLFIGFIFFAVLSKSEV